MPPIAQRLILIVEDEAKLAELLADYLHQAGFATIHEGDGGKAVERVRDLKPDLILLDLMLPNKDGLSICRELRGFSQVPVIMTTARVEEIDRLLGLELGADDYICKPYSPREVVARVKALFRRIDAGPGSGVRESGFELDEARYEVRFRGQPLELTPVEFRLLATLLAQPGRVFARAQLLNHLYFDHRVVTDRTVDSHIKNLRKKLAVAAPGEELIAAVYGVGYRLELPER